MNRTADTQDSSVHCLVSKARRIIITARLIIGFLLWVLICAGLWLVMFFLDNLFHLPAGLRLALTVSGVAIMALTFYKYLLAAAIKWQPLPATALLLEGQYNVNENMLINAFQFESARLPRSSKPFARKTIGTCLALMAKASLKDLWRLKTIIRYLVIVLLILLLWTTYALSQGHRVANALARFANPLADIPPAGSVLLKVTPGADVTITEGDDLRIVVEVKSKTRGDALESYPTIAWTEDADFVSGDKTGSKTGAMQPADEGDGAFSYTFSAVRRPLAFRVFAADTYSRNTIVSVNSLPRIIESQFIVTPPPYTGDEFQDIIGPPQTLFALADSKVDIQVKLDKQVERMWFSANGATIPFEKDKDLWTAHTAVTASGSYTVEVKKKDVDKNLRLAEGAISLQPDKPPQVAFMAPSNNMTVNPGQRLALDLQAVDDFGLRDIHVTLNEAAADSEARKIKEWKFDGPPGRKGRVEETLLLSIDSAEFKPGSSYVLQAFAVDFCPAENTGKSEPLVIRVRSLDELTVDQNDPASSAFAELDKAIAAQQSALGATTNLSVNLEDIFADADTTKQVAESLKKHQRVLKDKQEQVAGHLTKAWDVSPQPRPPFVEKMIALRDGAGKQVIDRIKNDALISPGDVSVTAAELRSVEKLQAYILDQLIALKGMVAAESKAQAEKEAAEILGEEEDVFDMTTEDILEKTAKELDEFVKAQKKIMEERTMLMDLPAEDFSEEDHESLDQLAVDQSKLAEILSEAVNDFTNLDLQDFGDNAMVDQMTSIYEKAEDLADTALEAAEKRMARVDAYRLETEAVEMAEEILINCEATLGFTDSIQFIAEVPEDEQLVAPLAELPFELEDLVGDLITTEEEMQPEVEDIGSYLNSLDHTAGPVADGTISSTSAKGKTGDQRPEDNIIQGRSGAGRTGMSDGQLVESVAKDLDDNEYGLRERLSNTALESGQVKDEDLGAQTGGTGLGKTTDASSPFGVGGKLPPKMLEMMRQTAEKQLNTRQAAEAVITKLAQHNLPTAALENSVQNMKAVENALEARDGVGIRKAYSGAVDSLRKSRYDINKQISIRYATDATITKDLENMSAEKKQGDFEGYESIISAYFQALANDEDKAADN